MDIVREVNYYSRCRSVVFLKKDPYFGGLSNMALGYSLTVNGVEILASEMLYQACRFPNLPDVQRLIIEAKSPVSAKRISKTFEELSRNDWTEIRVDVMNWCLHVKLAQNWHAFGKILKSTDNLPIIEESKTDNFWGAIPDGNNTLVGSNVLGNLLMKLRNEYSDSDRELLPRIDPPPLDNFLLYGNLIGTVFSMPSNTGIE